MTISKIGGPKFSKALQDSAKPTSQSNFRDVLRNQKNTAETRANGVPKSQLPRDYAAANSPYAKLQSGLQNGSPEHSALEQLMQARTQLLSALHNE